MRLTARRAKHRTAPPSRSSSPFDKNIPLRVDPKSDLQLGCPPHWGAYHDRHVRGMGCGGRGSAGHEVESQGGFSPWAMTACGRPALKRTAKPRGPGTRCWCQVGGVLVGPTGPGKTSLRRWRRQERIRLRGDRGI